MDKTINLARKVRLYPNEEQKEFFNNCFQFSNRAWNICHESYRKYEYRIAPNCFIFNKQDNNRFHKNFSNYGQAITRSKNEYDKLADSKIKNYIVKSYNNAWKKYYNEKKAGKPNFHSFRRSKLSYTSDTKKITDNELILPKIGKIKCRGKLLNEDVANFTVSLVNGKYYCSIIYKNVSIKPKVHTNMVLGMDWGEKTFFSLDNGMKLNPKIDFELEKKINDLQSKLSKKIGSKKGETKSNSYLKLKSKSDKLKEYRNNVLGDWEHQKTHMLVSLFDYIFIEDISYKNLHQMKDKGVSKLKKIYYRAGMFTNKLVYKLDWYKESLHKVYPHNTSKTCSVCGFILDYKLGLNVREWRCPKCETLHDRDVNAAINIRNRGLSDLGLELGTNFIRRKDSL
ncbi:MAG: transposase [Methanobrevibacter sp.]|jgi:putative transposase|nr:transposase [Candidatus Methanovirga australis]